MLAEAFSKRLLGIHANGSWRVKLVLATLFSLLHGLVNGITHRAEQ